MMTSGGIDGLALDAPSHGAVLVDRRPVAPPAIAARTGPGRRIVERLRRKIERLSSDAERISFAPVMARSDLERVGYFRNFPHLLGVVSCFCGDEAAHRSAMASANWATAFQPSDLVLTPAACYPVYPLAALDGDVGADGRLFHLSSWCFRREASAEPGRLQAFEMLEYVRIGSPEQVLAFRRDWIDRAEAFAEALGLDAEIAPANDPFFGRAAGVMAQSQRTLELKYELTTQVGPATWAAAMSFNYHLTHFGEAFGLRRLGETAHTGCVGFGLDRLALALIQRHGADTDRWPSSVRAYLASSTQGADL